MRLKLSSFLLAIVPILCLTSINTFAATTADEYWKQGCNYFEEKNYEEAAKLFKKAVELKPDNAVYHCNLGITYYNLGNYEEALKHLEKAEELAPESQAGKLAKEQIAEIERSSGKKEFLFRSSQIGGKELKSRVENLPPISISSLGIKILSIRKQDWSNFSGPPALHGFAKIWWYVDLEIINPNSTQVAIGPISYLYFDDSSSVLIGFYKERIYGVPMTGNFYAIVPSNSKTVLNFLGVDTSTTSSVFIKKPTYINLCVENTKKEGLPGLRIEINNQNIKELEVKREAMESSRKIDNNISIGSDSDGFRNIKWGTDISALPEMKYWRSDPSFGGTKFYLREGDELRMGAAILEKIKYAFWRGKFLGVQIFTTGFENWSNLKSATFEKFGKGYQKDKYLYTWQGPRTWVALEYDPISKETRLIISSAEIYRQQLEYQKEKAKEGARKGF